MSTKVAVTITAVTAVILFVIGFLVGRNSVDEPETVRIVEVKWVRGDEVRDSIFIPEVITQTRVDSFPVFIYTDTAALYKVWEDYYLQREYALDFSADTLGIFKVEATVTQNQLVKAVSTIRPIYKIETVTNTVYTKDKFVPWVMVGTSLGFDTQRIQLGLDLNERYMVGASGIRLDNNWNYTVDFGIKFK